MRKKILSFILILMSLITMVSCNQYNSKGISGILNITIDETQPIEYIGELEDYSIFVEKLKIDALYFITIDAKNISLREAISKELVSIEDWKKGARRIISVGDTEILRYENYEIAITEKNCIIRPLTK